MHACTCTCTHKCMQAMGSIQTAELMLNTDPPIYNLHCRFLESSLISGEGLVSVGVASDAAQEEVTRIHRENVQRLAGFSEEEILKEKERIQQTLGMLQVHHAHIHVCEHKCKTRAL